MFFDGGVAFGFVLGFGVTLAFCSPTFGLFNGGLLVPEAFACKMAPPQKRSRDIVLQTEDESGTKRQRLDGPS